MEIIIRKYKPSDCRRLMELFYDTVHSVNAGDYTVEQLDAWAPKNMDGEQWKLSFREHITAVAEINGRIAGFGDIDEAGCLDRLFTGSEYQGMGVGSAVCGYLESSVNADKYTAFVSVTARTFFEKRGYTVVRENTAVRSGVALKNFLMEKRRIYRTDVY